MDALAIQKPPEQETGYVVIRQEDAQAFSREVRELTAALLMPAR